MLLPCFNLYPLTPTTPTPLLLPMHPHSAPQMCCNSPNFTCHGCWLQQLREIHRDRGADRNVLGWEETRARLSKTHCASDFCHPCNLAHLITPFPQHLVVSHHYMGQLEAMSFNILPIPPPPIWSMPMFFFCGHPKSIFTNMFWMKTSTSIPPFPLSSYFVQLW